MDALSPALTSESDIGFNWKSRVEDHHFAGSPVGRAHAARLQRLQNSKSLVRASTNIEIVDNCVLQYPVRIDNEKSPQRNSFVLD